MRILVAGSRAFDDRDLLYMILNEKVPVNRIGLDTIIQGFSKGPDRMAYDWARFRRLDIETYLPDWRKHGKAAGPIRNKEMIYSKPDLVLIFYGPYGETRGTKNTEDLAREAGIPVEVYYQEMDPVTFSL